MRLKQYKDYKTISELLMEGKCPPDVFALMVGWVSGKLVPITNKKVRSATNATPSSGIR